jgi:hypothetical protein
MNKTILAIALLTIMIAMTAPVFATTPACVGICPTEATVGSGGGTAPIVKAKWETPDQNPNKAWTQINPPMTFGATKTIGYWAVVTDNDGVGTIATVYADVWHPDKTFKYEIPLYEIKICDENMNVNQTALNYVLASLEAANAGSYVKYKDSYDLNETERELKKCDAKAYYGERDIDYCQMCGEFNWTLKCDCPTCTPYWKLNDWTTGYKVTVVAYDTSAKNGTLTNYFEYMCSAGVEVDFNKLDFENVPLLQHKQIAGDDVWDPVGPACKPVSAGGLNPACISPTIRNIGNTPVTIDVLQDDMGFGNSSTNSGIDWNVQWDARLAENAFAIFDPYETRTLPGTLDRCIKDQISFSIYIKKPYGGFNHAGNVTITPHIAIAV